MDRVRRVYIYRIGDPVSDSMVDTLEKIRVHPENGGMGIGNNRSRGRR